MHFDHIAAQPSGLHVPYLGLGCPSATDRSPAITLYTDASGRALVRRHPFEPHTFMVCIHLDSRPVWVSTEHLAHRNCEHCIDVWERHWNQARTVLNSSPDAALYALTDLPERAGTTTAVLLHATEIPETLCSDTDRVLEAVE